MNTITDLIKDNINDEMYVQAAISRVCALLESQKFNLLTENSQYLLYKLMKVHSNNAKIQLSVFKIIEYGLISISNSKILNNNQQSDSYQDQLNFLNTNFVETFFYIFLVRYFFHYSLCSIYHIYNFNFHNRNTITQGKFNFTVLNVLFTSPISVSKRIGPIFFLFS